MRLYYKLLFSFLALAGLTGILGFVAIEINSGSFRNATSIVDSVIPETEAAEEMYDAVNKAQAINNEVLIRKFAPHLSTSQTTEDVTALLLVEISKLEKSILDGRKATEKGIEINVVEDDLGEIEADEEELKILDQFAKELSLYKEQCLAFAKTTDAAQAVHMLENVLTPQTQRLQATILKYRNSQKEELHEGTSAVVSHLRQTNLILLISTVAALGVAALLGWASSRAILKPIRLLTDGSRRLAKGELDSPINYRSNDEFGVLTEAFNRMAQDLKSTTVSRNYVDGVLSSMVDPLIVLHPDQTIQSVNKAAIDLLGFSEPELLSRSFRDIINSHSQAETLIPTVLEKNCVRTVEVSYRTKTGDSIPMSFSASVLRNSAGIVKGIVCVAQDIRTRKEAELQLETAHRELVDASRRAGIAEMATGVLHNVGNVLNSVNIATAVIVEAIKKSRSANLSKIVDLMQGNSSDLGHFLANDPKGRKVLPYLDELSGHLACEQAKLLDELQGLTQNVEHIKQIVAVQQNYANAAAVTESIKVTDLVEDSLRLNSDGLHRQGITLVRQFDAEPTITVEKHKVLQILVNLIRNAKYACEESSTVDKRITIRINHGGDDVRIDVTDNGVGIPSENLIRIFNHGFTTRTGGHGFGLHSSALAAKEMGGSLNVVSEGPGKGAMFTLQLPVQPRSKMILSASNN